MVKSCQKQQLKMKLYHITANKNAKLIVKNGFKDGIGYYGVVDSKTGQSKISKGVFLSDEVFTQRRKNENDCVFKINIPAKEIKQYEWVEEIKSYREWCIPAQIVNKYFTDRKIYSCYDELLYEKPKRKIPFNKLGSMSQAEIQKYLQD